MEPDRVLSQLLSGPIMRACRAVSVLSLMVLFGTVCAEPEVLEKSIFNLSDKVDECSGIVASRAYPGVFWTHEDGGLSNNLYAVDAKGDFLFKTDVSGAKNVDWEDIAIDDEGNLYVGDVGNNKNKRDDLLVYKIREPNPNDPNSQASVSKRIRFRYPSQTGFPDPADLNYDAEALFFVDGSLYILTKNRSETTTDLYCFRPRCHERDRLNTSRPLNSVMTCSMREVRLLPRTCRQMVVRLPCFVTMPFTSFRSQLKAHIGSRKHRQRSYSTKV